MTDHQKFCPGCGMTKGFCRPECDFDADFDLEEDNLLFDIFLALMAALLISVAYLTARPAIGAEPLKELTKYGVPDSTGVSRGRYLAGYDGRTRSPRWVLERLDSKQLKVTVDRDSESFHADREVPSELRVDAGDYRGSGFDIGHLAPAATHRTNQADLDSTFLFSNATPQQPQFNRGLWRTLESEVRTRAEASPVWVITCPLWIPSGGTLQIRTIGPHGVWVPSHCGKAVLIEGAKGVSVESWILPNVELKGRETAEFRVSVDEFETAAGLDLWNELPDEIETKIEALK